MARPNIAPEHWQPLIAACGGVNGLAQALGVHVVTINGWYTAKHSPGKFTIEAIQRLAAERGVPSPY